MYIDANSVLRQQVLRAALEQYAADQMRKLVGIAGTFPPDDTAAAACHTRWQEARDVLEELEMHRRRRQQHPASRLPPL